MSSQYLMLHCEYTTYILSTFIWFGIMVCYLDHTACSVGVGNSMLSLPLLWEECVKNWVVNDLLSFSIFTQTSPEGDLHRLKNAVIFMQLFNNTIKITVLTGKTPVIFVCVGALFVPPLPTVMPDLKAATLMLWLQMPGTY